VIDSRKTDAEHLGTVELRIPAKAEWVAVARLAVSAVANRLAFSLEDIEDLKLALTEACANCIQRADGGGEGIDVTFEVLTDALRIVVRDRMGHAQDARSVRPIVSQMREERTEGVGIYIIQSLMDVVEYKVDANAGTELAMIKRVRA
jgi:serine/threonine-protein kinase RsbW